MKKDLKKKPVAVQSKKVKQNLFDKTTLVIYAIIIAFAFVLYGNTIGHDYALDDSYVILQNDFTKKGFNGIGDILTKDFFAGKYEKYGKNDNIITGGRYRPLSLVTFAIEYGIYGEKPHISHLINIIFYAILCMVLYNVMRLLFINFKPKNWYLSIPFLGTILFMAHPLHTEVVANIKGRDEILTLLGSLLAWLMVLRYVDSKQIKYLFYSFIWFFLGLMAKENSITFLAVIPLSLYFFRKTEIKKSLLMCILLFAASIIFLIIRQSVMGKSSGEPDTDILNNPFLGATFIQRYSTIIYTLGIYIKLLFFPHPLTFDYYPYHIPIINFLDLRNIIPLLINLALVVFAILTFKKKNFYSFNIILYFATLSPASNIFFPIGVFMNERFIFASSIGFCLILAYLAIEKLPRVLKSDKTYKMVIFSSAIIVLLLYSGKTISRNFAWKDNRTLFTTDIKVSSNSIKCNSGLGEIYYHDGEKITDVNERKKVLFNAMTYLRKAIKLHPSYANAMILYANAHFEYNRNIDSTMYYYTRIVKAVPGFMDVYRNLPVVLQSVKDTDKKIRFLEEINSYNPNRYDVTYELGLAYARDKHEFLKAIPILEKSVSLNPQYGDSYNALGMAFGMTGDFTNALKNLLSAENLLKNNKQILINIAITYQNLGNAEKSKEYFDRANAMK